MSFWKMRRSELNSKKAVSFRFTANNSTRRQRCLTHNGGVNSPEKRKPFIEAIGKVFPGEVLFPDELTTIDLLN